MKDTLNCLRREADLKFLGLATKDSDVPLSALTKGGLQPLADDEIEFGTCVASLALHFIFQRLRSLLWHIEGLPGSLVDLVSGEASTITQRLTQLKELNRIWMCAKKRAGRDEGVQRQIDKKNPCN